MEIRIVIPAERGPLLQAGETDMLSSVTTWTSSRDAQWGNFTQTMFYDGQGFIVKRGLGVNSALELRYASVCVTQGTTTELNLQDFSNESGLNLNAVTFERSDAALEAYRTPGSATLSPPTAPRCRRCWELSLTRPGTLSCRTPYLRNPWARRRPTAMRTGTTSSRR